MVVARIFKLWNQVENGGTLCPEPFQTSSLSSVLFSPFSPRHKSSLSFSVSGKGCLWCLQKFSHLLSADRKCTNFSACQVYHWRCQGNGSAGSPTVPWHLPMWTMFILKPLLALVPHTKHGGLNGTMDCGVIGNGKLVGPGIKDYLAKQLRAKTNDRFPALPISCSIKHHVPFWLFGFQIRLHNHCCAWR